MANRIRQLRKANGLSQQQLAEATGTSNQMIGYLERGERGLTVDWMEKIAAALQVTPADLLSETPQVPVVGYVGAGAEMHHYAMADHPNEYVPMIPGGNEHTVAVEIRGSSLGSIFDSWLVYYDEIRFPPTTDMLGKLCVIGLDDDRVLVKRLRRGSAPGLYNLESVTEALIEDARIIWAAKVKHMTPR
jgi:transcriptional regulator with XRE-family HTH domain